MKESLMGASSHYPHIPEEDYLKHTSKEASPEKFSLLIVSSCEEIGDVRIFIGVIASQEAELHKTGS